MKLQGEFLREVIFPVGGIGAGCIGIGGNGRFAEWEIFNHPDKGKINGFSHFAVRAEAEGKVADARILCGDLESDFAGSRRPAEDPFTGGYGFGPDLRTLCGMPHFQHCAFDGEFPVAELHFSDPGFPAEVTLRAWSPFVPGDSILASMPAAFFEIEFENTSAVAMDFTAVGALTNPFKVTTGFNCVEQRYGLTHLLLQSGGDRDSMQYGSLALTTDGDSVAFQEYWYRGFWQDSLEVYWHDMMQPGPFVNRTYPRPEADSKDIFSDGCRTGMLASTLHLAPGEKKSARFVISWHCPNCRNDWEADAEETARKNDLPGNFWKNYYARLCTSAADAGSRMMARFDDVREKVFRFRRALHDSTLPEAVVQGAAANLAVLISPTVLRVEDGTLWGWEGCAPNKGSCPGSCQHVWNYAQALPLLFPDLERSLRESQIRYGIDENGGWHFRLRLPLGIRAQVTDMRPCADGTFGEVMKCFREWKISGNTEWLKEFWPQLRRAVEYAWSPKNPGRWDPEQSGVLTGRQHHTLDLEMFGPSGWLNGHYLGALKAAAEMADACGDAEFGKLCREIFEQGRVWCEEHLFNGEYYAQAIRLDDETVLAPFIETERRINGDAAAENVRNFYWDDEHREIKYQIGEGCGIDAHLGQWYASLYGIGGVFDPARVRATLNAIYRYNFVSSLRDQANCWRVFALNDEGGCRICSWPAGRRKPVIPLSYNSEMMTGFEWAFAAHLVMAGETEKGAEIAAAIRARYDGRKRNPWNEIECGSNYARSMASFAMLQAYSGFVYDMTRGMIGFAPAVAGEFRCFWSLGSVWGVFERECPGTQTIRILYGSAVFRSFRLAARECRLNGNVLPVILRDGELHLETTVEAAAGDTLTFDW